MRVRPLSTAGIALALLLAGNSGAVAPPLAAEHLVVATLPALSPHWVFVYDTALNYETDARVYVYDGDRRQYD